MSYKYPGLKEFVEESLTKSVPVGEIYEGAKVFYKYTASRRTFGKYCSKIKRNMKYKPTETVGNNGKTHSTFVLLSDLHYPNCVSLKPIYDFVDDFKPDIVVYMGDFIDPSPISYFTRSKRNVVAQNARRFKDDVDGVKEFIHRTKGVENYYIIGNHENWLFDFTNEYPYFKGTVDDIKELLDIPDFDVVGCENYYGHIQLGKLKVIHGWYYGVYHSRKTVEAAEENIAYGHVHDYQVFTKVKMNNNEPHIGVSVPCLCNANPYYLKGKPNKWVNGFAFGAVSNTTGNFNIYPTVMIKGSFWANGKFYQ